MTPGRAWAALILGGIVTALVLLAAVTVVFAPTPATAPDAAAAARPVPASPPAPAPVTRPAPAPGTPTPASCDDIYSDEMVDAFGDLTLNPGWTTDPAADAQNGTDDPDLSAIVQASDHLTCRWANPAGPSDTGVATNLVWVTPVQATAVTDRLLVLGLNCYEELDGLRCITETESEDGRFGQSHFVRGGIWLATQWSNAGPDGYTHDIVATLWDGV